MLAAVPTARAASVTLYVQAPFDVKTGTFDLDELESVNGEALFHRSFFIPYETLEPLIRNQIKSTVDKTLQGTVVCSDPCPDVDYRVTFVSDFAFTDLGQPVVQTFGDATEHGVTVDLDAQAWIKLAVHAYAETWFDSADANMTIEVRLGLHATASLMLWPTIQAVDYDVYLTLDDSNVDIKGLNGEAVQLGAELGTFLGFTPLGLFFGGPLGLGVLLAFLGDAAAEEAKQRVTSLIEHRLEMELNKANDLLSTKVAGIIDPLNTQIQTVQQQVLHTPLPGVGQSLAQLQNGAGVSLDVRSHAANNQLRAVATTRFSEASQGGSFVGLLRLPKTRCIYARINHPLLGRASLPMRVDPANADLVPLLGNACRAVFSGAALTPSVYRGESPEKQLQSGNPANVLPSWTPEGSLNFMGTLVDQGSYYECGFTVSNLPAVSIVELQADADMEWRLTELHPSAERVMNLPFGPLQIVLNSELAPYGPNGVLLGGKGPNDTGDCPATHTDSGGVQKPFDFGTRFDPESCPQCGLKRFLGLRNEVIYEISNPEALLTTVNDSPLFQVNTSVVQPRVSPHRPVDTGMVNTRPSLNPSQGQSQFNPQIIQQFNKSQRFQR